MRRIEKRIVIFEREFWELLLFSSSFHIYVMFHKREQHLYPIDNKVNTTTCPSLYLHPHHPFTTTHPSLTLIFTPFSCWHLHFCTFSHPLSVLLSSFFNHSLVLYVFSSILYCNHLWTPLTPNIIRTHRHTLVLHIQSIPRWDTWELNPIRCNNLIMLRSISRKAVCACVCNEEHTTCVFSPFPFPAFMLV